MNTNDAADVLRWHDERREQMRAKWRQRQAAGQPIPPRKSAPLGNSWKPTMTAEQKAAHDEYVQANNCPF